jgi:hypothetical protein
MVFSGKSMFTNNVLSIGLLENNIRYLDNKHVFNVLYIITKAKERTMPKQITGTNP